MSNYVEQPQGVVVLSDFKPGEWGTHDGLPSIVWWRYGVAAEGEPTFVQQVQKYASDADRIAAYQAFTTPEPAGDREVENLPKTATANHPERDQDYLQAANEDWLEACEVHLGD